MLSDSFLLRALEGTAAIPWKTLLARRVPLFDLIANLPPKFLWASGKPNRFNLSGTECIYFSENEQTAQAEYLRPLAGTGNERQPVATFWAEVALERLLDLRNVQIRKELALSEEELFAGWRLALQPTATQMLGEAINGGAGFSAICFPSDAARAEQFEGANLVIFRNQVKVPDFVKIFGPKNEPIEVWP